MTEKIFKELLTKPEIVVSHNNYYFRKPTPEPEQKI